MPKTATLVKFQKGCWKFDENDEACYIDIEDSEDEDLLEREYSEWNLLPDILLEKIFTYLSVRERYYASMVCRQWYRGFHLPPVWTNFIVDDKTLTRAKFNYYSGWHYVLDHQRTQMCLARVGRYIKGLEFRPIHSFQNLYQFMSLLAWCIEKNSSATCPPELKGIGDKIRSLSYIFPCNMSQSEDPQGIKLFGTGGQLLAVLKSLLANLTKLKSLKLVDLVLERYEANHLLDEVLDSCCTILRYLNLINVTTVHCPILHIGLFLNLQILVISPQNLSDDVITLLADSKVKHLHIYQNRYTPSAIGIRHCSAQAWRVLKRDNPDLKVHIRVESTKDSEFVFQPEAPVYSILYNTPKTKITPDLTVRIVDNYKKTLAIFGHELLPRFVSPKSFHSRVDSLLLLLVRDCRYINTIIIREKISTATVLLIARNSPNLKKFCVRRFAVIIRCDWPKNPEWSEEYYNWLKISSKSYELVEKEVSDILKQNWSFMSDKEYKKIDINVRSDYL